MSLQTYDDLRRLVAAGAITGVDPKRINAASIDLTLGTTIQVEARGRHEPVDLANKESIKMREITMGPDGYVLQPGEFILAHTDEVFHLPTGQRPEIVSGQQDQPMLEYRPAIAGEYKLKSSMARNALGHLLAGWCDPGWSGSVLTLELKNESLYHPLRIRPGMAIGQIVLWVGAPVPPEGSYATKGRYNGDLSATASRGIE
jgi:dCTP deaminase